MDSHSRAGRDPAAQQICVRCVMDRSDPAITFDDHGLCNHCRRYETLVRTEIWDRSNSRRLTRLVDSIRREGEGKDYDSILGVSGGVDSTFLAYTAKKLGLRPLAVHVDNGWNSSLAVENIERVLNGLGMDLVTEVLDWEEFRDIQLAFLRASTPDSEIPTDHAIQAVLMRVARAHGLRFIISGSNVRSEAILPLAWSQGIRDWKYIKSVHQQFGTKQLENFPHFTLVDFIRSRYIWRQQWIPLLNYIDYSKTEALRILQDQLGWVYYGGKHYESIYTRFFQAYVLPRKFGADKRRAHISTLICSGELTREAGLAALEQPNCNPQLLRQDREFVIKKLGLTEETFEQIMSLPAKTIADYPAYQNSWYLRLLRALYRMPRYFRRLSGAAIPRPATPT